MLDDGNSLNIRRWRQEDLEKVRLIFWETWVATYSAYIPESDIHEYLDAQYSLKALHEMFVDDNVYGFVAEASKAVVGCARCIHARAEARFYLTSLYVLPRFQQRGIGARLLNEAEQQAEACGYDRVWLGVMEKNTIACAWYKKIGFTFVEEAPFTMGTTTVQHVIGYKPIARCQTQENLLSRSHKE